MKALPAMAPAPLPMNQPVHADLPTADDGSCLELVAALRGSALAGSLLHASDHCEFVRYPENPPGWLKSLNAGGARWRFLSFRWKVLCGVRTASIFRAVLQCVRGNGHCVRADRVLAFSAETFSIRPVGVAVAGADLWMSLRRPTVAPAREAVVTPVSVS